MTEWLTELDIKFFGWVICFISVVEICFYEKFEEFLNLIILID